MAVVVLMRVKIVVKLLSVNIKVNGFSSNC